MLSRDGTRIHRNVLAITLIVASVLIFCSIVDNTALFGDSTPPTPHTITFDANGGTIVHTSGGNTDSDPYTPTAYDSQYIPGNEFIIEGDTYEYSRTNYSFLGWATSPTAVNPNYVEGNVASVNDLSSSGYTLYAVWKANMYEVILHFDEGHQAKITMPYEAKFDTSSYINSFEAPSGYRVVGWSVAELNKVGDVYVIPTDPENPGDYVKTYSHIITLESEGVTLYPILALYKNLTNAALTITDNGCYFVTGGSEDTPVSSNPLIIGNGSSTISPFIFTKSLYMDFSDTSNNTYRSPMIIRDHATATMVVIDDCYFKGMDDYYTGGLLSRQHVGFAGINVQSGATLIISENCTGILTVIGGDSHASAYTSWSGSTAHSAAGIGSNGTSSGMDECGTIIINGGIIKATGGSASSTSIAGLINTDNITSGPGIGGENSDIEINGGTIYATSGQVYSEPRAGQKELYSGGSDLYPLCGDYEIDEDATVIINGRDDSEIVSPYTPLTLTINTNPTNLAINPASSLIIGDLSFNVDGMVITNGSVLNLSPELFKENGVLVNSINVAVIDANSGQYYSGTATKDGSGNYTATISRNNDVNHGTVTIYKGDDSVQTTINQSNDFGYIEPYQTYTIQSEGSSITEIFYVNLSPGYVLNGVYIKQNHGSWIEKDDLDLDENSRVHVLYLELSLSSGSGTDNYIAFDIQRKAQTVTITNNMHRGDSDFTSSLITSSSNDPAISFNSATDKFTQVVYYGDSRTYTIHLYKDVEDNPVRLMMITRDGVEIDYTDNHDNTYTFSLNGIEADCNIEIVYSHTVKVRANQSDIHSTPVSVTLVNSDGSSLNHLVWYKNGIPEDSLIWYPDELDPDYCYAYIDLDSPVYFQLGPYNRIDYGVYRIDITYDENTVTLGSNANNFYAIPNVSMNTTINITMGDTVYDVEYESEGITRLMRIVDGAIIEIPDIGEFGNIDIIRSGNGYAYSTPLTPKGGYDIDYWLYSGVHYEPGSQIKVTSDMHLVAVWMESARQYSITYDLDGGSFEEGYENPASYDINSSFTVDNTTHGPIKTGYTFIGWTGSNGGVPQKTITIDGSTMAENLSYVAVWSPKPITITYRDELKNINLGTQSYFYGDLYTGLPICNNFTEDGVYYTFAGWAVTWDAEHGYGEKITNTTRVDIDAATHTIYVIWIPNGLYIVNILDNGNGGTVVPSVNMSAGGSTIDLTITPFAGYNPTNLYINGVEDQSYGAGTTSYSITIPDNGTYVVSIRVTFSHVAQTITMHYGINEPQDIRTTTFYVDSNPIMITRSEVGTHEGYRFIGWQGTGITGTETEYILIPTGTVGNLEYYEVWQNIIFDITYVLNGGTNNINNPSTYISGYTVILEDPTYGIYTFSGWYLDPQFDGSPIQAISSNMSGNITLYAKWLKIRVFFDANGGIGNEMEPIQGATGEEIEIPENEYEYDGRVFKEWNTASTGTGDSYLPGDTYTLGNTDLRLYAIWYIIVDRPSLINDHVYDGVAVNIVAGTGYSVSGATTATYWRSGGYTTTFELDDGYIWDDMTFDPVVSNWQIMKRTAFIVGNSFYLKHGTSPIDSPTYYTLGLVSGDFTITPGDVDTTDIGSYRNAITCEISSSKSAYSSQILGSYDLVIIDGYVIVYDENSSTVIVDINNGSVGRSMQIAMSMPTMMAVPNRRYL